MRFPGSQYVRQYADPEHKVKFVGLALEDPTAWDYYRTFLNASNHAPGTPLGPSSTRTAAAVIASTLR